MEFTKEISFEEKLTADKVAKINYHGKLLNTNSDSISIVYGYGQNWDYTDEKSMVKVDNGYEVEIPMKSYDTFNFCFKDGYNNWDNNNTQNYIFPIEKIQTDLVVTQENEYSLDKHIGLRKSYIWSKKIKLAIYKILTYIPKLVSGNFKRKLYNND